MIAEMKFINNFLRSFYVSYTGRLICSYFAVIFCNSIFKIDFYYFDKIPITSKLRKPFFRRKKNDLILTFFNTV